MNNSTTRYRSSTSIRRLAVATRAVECGFIAAGVTVALIAAFQSVTTVLSWVGAL